MVDTDPIYTDNRVTGRDIVVYAGSTTEKTSNVTVECFRVPIPVNWTWTVVNNQALYNASAADLQNFELHVAEEDALVFKILELAGVIVNSPDIASLANQKSQEITQQVKQ